MGVLNIHAMCDGVGHLFTFPWSQIACELLKKYPGVRYAPDIRRGHWYAPEEAVGYLKAVADKLGMGILGPPKRGTKPRQLQINTQDLYPYQADAVTWLSGKPAGLLALDMGLGKTACAIRTIETVPRLKGKKILVVCPAAVKTQWLDQWGLWYSKKPKIGLKIIKGGKDLDCTQSGLYIASYALLGALCEASIPWDIIVWDEIHYLSNAKSKRSRAAFKIVENHRPELQLGLSGTPIPDRPTDLWHPLHVLFPNRQGTWFKFAKRYACAEKNAYSHSGLSFHGLNPAFTKELKHRLQYTTRRVTKSDVVHLLPPFILTRIPLDRKTSKDYGTTQKGHQRLIGAQRKIRVKAAIEWAEEKIVSGCNHLVIFTHTRETGKAISSGLSEQIGVLINGGIKPEDRDTMIKDARTRDRSVIIATMASCGIGLDSMKAYTTGLLAELPYWPAETLQAMARLHRLGSPGAVNIDILGSDDPLSQVIEFAIKSKLKDMNDILKGGAEKDLKNALTSSESIEEWASRLANLTTEEDIDGSI